MKKDQQQAPRPAPVVPRWALAVVILLVVVGSAIPRLSQYGAWQESPERFFVDGRPLMSSTDSYFWLRQADEHRAGTYGAVDIDPLQNYPDGAPRARPIPLPSLLVSWASTVSGGDPYAVAARLFPALAGLLAIPLIVYFSRAGLPAAGILAALVTSFGHAYYARTSVGGVDTDPLNLFFPLMASLFVWLTGDAETRGKRFLYAALAGLTLLLFVFWYKHPGFTVVYLVSMIACLGVRRLPWKEAGLAAAVFVIAANPIHLWQGVQGISKFLRLYLRSTDTSTAGIRLPNVGTTVTEAQRESWVDTLGLVLEPSWLTAIGLLLFVPLVWKHWRRLLPLAPLLILGLLAFRGGRRFAMFLGPFVGAGLGWAVGWLAQELSDRLRLRGIWRAWAPYLAAVMTFVILIPTTAIGFVPSPRPSAGMISAIADLRDRLPTGAPVLSWWDYGYALAAVGGFATFHDGSYHDLDTYLISRALISRREDELYNTIASIQQKGLAEIRHEIETAADPVATLERMGRSTERLREEVFVALFEPMVRKYAVMHYLGSWDPDGNPGAADGYQSLDCSDWSGGKIRCRGMTIDMTTGYVRDDLSLERMVILRDGRTLQEVDFPNDTDVVLQVLTTNEGIQGMYLLTEQVYESSFNRMYFLGRYDRSLFEEIRVGRPGVRVFRALPAI